MTKINKETDKGTQPDPKKDPGYVDTARMDVQCHVVIRDKDTKQDLVNKRG